MSPRKMSPPRLTTTVFTRIIEPHTKALELPLLLRSGNFVFCFCLRPKLEGLVFAERLPYQREVISGLLARSSIITVILQLQLYRLSTSAADKYISQMPDMLTLQREGSLNLSYQTIWLIYLSAALVCQESLMAQLPSKPFNLFLAAFTRLAV